VTQSSQSSQPLKNVPPTDSPEISENPSQLVSEY